MPTRASTVSRVFALTQSGDRQRAMGPTAATAVDHLLTGVAMLLVASVNPLEPVEPVTTGLPLGRCSR